jgi:hypothetical protein
MHAQSDCAFQLSDTLCTELEAAQHDAIKGLEVVAACVESTEGTDILKVASQLPVGLVKLRDGPAKAAAMADAIKTSSVLPPTFGKFPKLLLQVSSKKQPQHAISV